MPSINRHRRFVIVTLWVFLVPGALLAAPFQNTWSVKELAASDGERVQLRNRRNKPVKTVETRQMRYLYAVETSMEKVAEVQADLLLVDGEQPNAFAGEIDGKGNVVGINFAMLDVLDTDLHAAAALIGHELAHLRLDHGDKTQTRSSVIGAMKVLGGVALESFGVPGGQTVSDLTFTSIETKYSRDQERQADYLGVVWAVEAGYEPDGAVRLHEKIHERSKSGPLPFLSSHPSGPERISTLKSLSERLSK